MDVMTHIQQVFIDLNLVKRLKKIQVVEVISKGKTTTWMKTITIPIIKELNPIRQELPLVPNQYYTWVYNHLWNRDLLMELGASRYPTRPLVLIVSASPIYIVQRFLCCTGVLHRVPREKFHKLYWCPTIQAPSSMRLIQL
jgi:hypothetical protein